MDRAEPKLSLEVHQETLRCETLGYHDSPCAKDAQHICADCFDPVCIGCSDPCYDCGEHLHPGLCRDFHAKETGHSVDVPQKSAFELLIEIEVERVCKRVDASCEFVAARRTHLNSLENWK